MSKSLLTAMLIIIFVELCGLVYVFNYNLPHWCSSTEIDINQLVQPLCK